MADGWRHAGKRRFYFLAISQPHIIQYNSQNCVYDDAKSDNNHSRLLQIYTSKNSKWRTTNRRPSSRQWHWLYCHSSVKYNLILMKFLYTVSQKKNKQNYFCYITTSNFPPNLTIFGTKMANSLKLYEVHSFSTSPNLCHCKLLHNAVDLSDCSHLHHQFDRMRHII